MIQWIITVVLRLMMFIRVRTLVSEKMVLQTQNDGGLQNFEIKGELTLTVFDASASKIKVQISQGQNKEFQFKV